MLSKKLLWLIGAARLLSSLSNAFLVSPRIAVPFRPLQKNSISLTTLPLQSPASARKFSSISNNADDLSPDGIIDGTLSKLTSAFPLWVVGACLVALKRPSALTWVNKGQTIELMLAFVMIGMGMTLEKKDFEDVLSDNWSAVPFGVLCQFGIMPAAAWIVGRKMLLPIDPSLYLGLALVGCSPGGTASNLVALIAGANVALSVLLTACSTILAAVMTPLLVKILVGGTELMVSGKALCFATAKVVLGPVVIGMTLNAKLPKLSKNISRFTPFSSVLLVAIICGGVMATNASAVLTLGSLFPRILAAVVGTHAIGFASGYFVPKALGGYDESTSRTISIETGMQNSALAVVLAQSIGAPPLAALPGAISALTHSCLGSLMAAYWRIKDTKAAATDDT
jgi:bile acid:Na+ symporter, BASS family